MKAFSIWNLTLKFEMGLFKLPCFCEVPFSFMFVRGLEEKWSRWFLSLSSPRLCSNTFMNVLNIQVLQTHCALTCCHCLNQLFPLPRASCLQSPCSHSLRPAQARFLSGHSHLWTWQGYFVESCLWWLNLVGGRVEKAGVSLCRGDFPMLKIVILCSTPPSPLKPQKKRSTKAADVQSLSMFCFKMFSRSEDISFWAVKSGEVFWFPMIKPRLPFLLILVARVRSDRAEVVGRRAATDGLAWLWWGRGAGSGQGLGPAGAYVTCSQKAWSRAWLLQTSPSERTPTQREIRAATGSWCESHCWHSLSPAIRGRCPGQEGLLSVGCLPATGGAACFSFLEWAVKWVLHSVEPSAGETFPDRPSYHRHTPISLSRGELLSQSSVVYLVAEEPFIHWGKWSCLYLLSKTIPSAAHLQSTYYEHLPHTPQPFSFCVWALYYLFVIRLQLPA